MRYTFISTVFNEEKTVETFLRSVYDQIKPPDEVIIVDAQSSDKTFYLLKKWQKKFLQERKKIKFTVLRKKGNRSFGRNFAIGRSNNSIIAVSDAGCILKKDWAKKITLPFKDEKIKVVAGFYKPITTNIFEKCLACYTCVMEDRVRNDFLPSSRSIAFRKSAWEEVNGYPENLNTCEDLVFAKKLQLHKFKFKVVTSAIVYWPQRKNILEACRQFYSYAYGDGVARYIRFSTPFLFGRYFLAILFVLYCLQFDKNYYLLLLIPCMLLYSIWAIAKNYKYVGSFQGFFFLPILQFASDVMVLVGMTSGLLSKSSK